MAFEGIGSDGQKGIYTDIGGSLIKIIDLDDPLDGKLLANLDLQIDEALSGHSMAFLAQFTDGSEGIFRADVLQIGDMDCDGDIDFDDIDPFVLGLREPDEYEEIFGLPPDVKGDTDGDLDFDDIAGLVNILSNNKQTIPEPSSCALLAIGSFLFWGRKHMLGQKGRNKGNAGPQNRENSK